MGLIRLFLAAAVVLEHSTPILGIELTGGRVAVECFFVISGFYMAMVLTTRYNKVEGRLWRTFMASRVARLLPVYLAVVLLTVVAVALGVTLRLGDRTLLLGNYGDLSPLTAAALVASNMTLLGQDIVTFGAIDPTGAFTFTRDPLGAGTDTPAYLFLAVPQAWSISIELVFYMLAPFLVRWRTKTLVLVLVLSLAARLAMLLSGFREDPWTYRLAPLELAYFIAGMLAYRLSQRYELPARLASSRLLVPGVLLALAMYQLVARPAVAIVVPLLFALVVPALFAKTKSNKLDRRVGELSYPIYIVHVLVVSVLASFGLAVAGWSALLASIVAALVLTALVDERVDRIRHRWLSSRMPTRSGADRRG